MSDSSTPSDPYEYNDPLYVALGTLTPLKLAEDSAEASRKYDDTFEPWWLRWPLRLTRAFQHVEVYHNARKERISALHIVSWYEEQLKRELIMDLKLGNYPAFGYLTPRLPGHMRQPVPTNLWEDGQIDWERSTIRNGSLAFESIRVLPHAEQTSETSSPRNAPSEIVERRLPGRPPSAAFVQQAYDNLRSRGAIHFTKTLTYNYEAIRKEASRLAPERKGKGFGNEVIRRTLTSQFNADKQSYETPSKL